MDVGQINMDVGQINMDEGQINMDVREVEERCVPSPPPGGGASLPSTPGAWAGGSLTASCRGNNHEAVARLQHPPSNHFLQTHSETKPFM
jgi:hypothetical protein